MSIPSISLPVFPWLAGWLRGRRALLDLHRRRVGLGEAVSLGEAYAMDSRNGATLLSIIGGHALAAVHEVIGHTREVAMHLSRRRRSVRVTDTGEMIPMKTHDYVLVNAVLDSGAPLMKQLRGGLPRGTVALGDQWD
jgi:predicted dehydrogenase